MKVWTTCFTEVDRTVEAISQAITKYGKEGWEPWYMEDVWYVPHKDGTPDIKRLNEGLEKKIIWFKRSEGD